MTTTDQRAHERITSLEEIVTEHIANHKTLEDSIKENTELTRTISENTSELVSLVKGIKGFRGFLLWLAPPVTAIGIVVAAVLVVWNWLKS